MFKTKLSVIVLGALFTLPAMAENSAVAPISPFTFNIGVVSDYIYRGITQTNHNFALQGGVDYAHISGLYFGAWASNVSWIKDSGAGDASIELDTYVGVKNAIAADLSYDVGYVRYNYLGAHAAIAPYVNADTAEVYAAATYKFVTLKYSYGLLDGFLTIPGAKGSSYIDLSAGYPLADTGVTIGAHVGKQTFAGAFADAQTPTLSYTDYRLNVSKDFSGYLVGLAYTGTDASTAWTYNGEQWGKSTIAMSVVRAF